MKGQKVVKPPTQTRNSVQNVLGSDNWNAIVKLDPKDLTLTTAQIFRGILQINADVSSTLTFPSAAQLIKEWPEIPKAGYSKTFTIRNDGTQPVTIVAGIGGEIDGDSTIAVSSYAAHYRLRFGDVTSGVEAYQIIRE
jgi:hypothetical protein